MPVFTGLCCVVCAAMFQETGNVQNNTSFAEQGLEATLHYLCTTAVHLLKLVYRRVCIPILSWAVLHLHSQPESFSRSETSSYTGARRVMVHASECRLDEGTGEHMRVFTAGAVLQFIAERSKQKNPSTEVRSDQKEPPGSEETPAQGQGAP
jgi:hypothetical protein